MQRHKQRPKYLDLGKISLPVPGMVSILHRISGVGMFLFLPLLLFVLHSSLVSGAAFDHYQTLLSYPLVKLLLFGLLWAFLHHTFAGIRFLFLDMHQGLELRTARASAQVVLLISLVLTVILGWLLW